MPYHLTIRKQPIEINALRKVFLFDSMGIALESLPSQKATLRVKKLAQKLQHACMALSLKTVAGKSISIELIPDIQQFLHENNTIQSPLVKLYFDLFQAFIKPEDPQHLHSLLASIDFHQAHLALHEIKSVYLLALNLCIKAWNAGKAEFGKIAFQLYQKGLKNDIFLENGYLDRFTYHNIAIAGLGLKEFQWTEAFLHEYKSKLEDKYREGAYRFSLAGLYYHKGDFGEALPLLQYTEFKDILHALESRKMMLKIFYEQEEYDVLESLLDSFKHFIRRQKRLTYHRQNYLNFIHFLEKILKEPADHQSLRTQIEKSDNLPEKAWLLSKLKA